MEYSIFSFRLYSITPSIHLSLQLKAHFKPLLSQFTRSSSFLSVSLLPVNFYSLLRYFNSFSTHTHTRTHIVVVTFSTRFSKDSFFFFFFATLKISAISPQDLNFASLPWNTYLRCSFSPLDSRVFPFFLSFSLFFDPCFSVKPQFSLASVKPRTFFSFF